MLSNSLASLDRTPTASDALPPLLRISLPEGVGAEAGVLGGEPGLGFEEAELVTATVVVVVLDVEA